MDPASVRIPRVNVERWTRPDRARLGRSRPGISFLPTSAGDVRLRRLVTPGAPRVLFAVDGPNAVEHYDALLAALSGQVDAVVYEPPGTGGSLPAAAFDFSFDAHARVADEVLDAVGGPRTLVFPCWLGFVAPQVRGAERLILPQTPSFAAMLRWADRVDPRRLVRTRGLGQLFVRLRRRSIARRWFRASVGHRACVGPFGDAADAVLAAGGCFCLATLMQTLVREAPRELPADAVVIWGSADRTHRGDLPGGRVEWFSDSGHCPELEEPERFAAWLVAELGR